VRRAKRTVREPMIKPKRGGRAITDIDIGDGAVGGELIVDDPPEVAMKTGD
jgi:hypothetical protein